MTEADTYSSPELRALYRHPHIRAVVRVDAGGEVVEHIGQAHSLRPDAFGAAVEMPVEPSEDEPEESLYIRTLEDDYLIIVFKDQYEFETLKLDVDETLAHDYE